MELLVAIAVGLMTAAGIYLILRRHTFPVILGLALLSYAVNLFIFASGRIVIGLPPIIDKAAAGYTDPLTQALVLTAIVISFGMRRSSWSWRSASFLESGHDRIDMTDDAGGRRVSHWIIAPVLLPAILGALHRAGDARRPAAAAHLRPCGHRGPDRHRCCAALRRASLNAPEAYFLGDWPAPFGIVLVLDRLSALMVALTAVLALVVQLYAIGSGWDARGRHFHALFMFQLMGLGGAFLTGDALQPLRLFRGAADRLLRPDDPCAAARRGCARACSMSPSTSSARRCSCSRWPRSTRSPARSTWPTSRSKLPLLPTGDAALIRVAAMLLLLVFAIKGALVPLQFWLPVTYANAPGPVAALFAVMTKVGAYAVIRVFITLSSRLDARRPARWSPTSSCPPRWSRWSIGALGTLGATQPGAACRLCRHRLDGHASSPPSRSSRPQATTAALYYLLHSTLATAALFLIADMVIQRRGTSDLRGALPPMPQSGLIAALYFAAAIAMAGMPPLSGFLGKLLILDAARDQMATDLAGQSSSRRFLTILGLAAAGSTLFWKAHASEHQTNPVPEPVPAALPFIAVGLLLALLALLTDLCRPGHCLAADHGRRPLQPRALYRGEPPAGGS